MSIAQSLLPEFDQEMEATRKVLERVPTDKLEWGPHEKSMTLRQLATHVANLPSWAQITLQEDEFDVAPPGGDEFTLPVANSTDELLGIFDQNTTSAREAIATAGDDVFMQSWTLKKAGEGLFSAPKAGVLRRFVMNHLIHHRGQLTVYLRLIGVPVPQTLGPTADEPDF
jgi:uncharacterized damage-inducible protein DinB